MQVRSMTYLYCLYVIIHFGGCLPESSLPFEEMATQLTSRVQTQKIKVKGADGSTQILQRPHFGSIGPPGFQDIPD